jgi:hypothetical protein
MDLALCTCGQRCARRVSSKRTAEQWVLGKDVLANPFIDICESRVAISSDGIRMGGRLMEVGCMIIVWSALRK